MKAKLCLLTFYCPACKEQHYARVNDKDGWQFNGNLERPTLSPSVFVNQGQHCPDQPACHMQITDGKIHYYPDCTHELRGQVVEMIDF